MTSNEDLLKLTKVKLLEKCEELEIKKCKSKNKSDIIALINKKINNEIKLNEYYIDDNIELLKKIENDFIDLIYFDPPYNTGRDFYDFDDKFKSKEEYIEFMRERIKECYRVLKKTGTIVIHIEPKISHYFISTPNLSLKRKLQERFKVYDIDEYRTSCLNYKTEELCNNLYLPDKKNKERKMHSILTYKMENKRNGCINRDKNGCKNIQKVFNYYMEYNERPEKYKRGVDLQKLQTVLTEPSNCS